MSLSVGSRIGPYEIQSRIGAGGMGEVYRARDSRLDRVVAIKILPDLFASDPERLARFEREAKTLATLNHPNVAQIYGTEQGDGVYALAIEFVDGEDLAQRLERGAIPLDEATAIAQQIADALEAAHEHGIIHRDLKPANVKVRPDGTVKVLDFGLAKAVDGSGGAGGSGGSGGEHLLNSPTITTPAMTQMGMILGTAAYMSPEQARGRPVDRRADIWAFGCLLYEMLSGLRPFTGDDVSLTLAAVLKENVDWTALPPDTPASIHRLLRRCLEKDPRKRLRSIGDARLDLDESAADPQPLLDPTLRARASARASQWPTALLWAFAGAAIAALVFAGLNNFGAPPPPRDVTVRSQITFPDTPLGFHGGSLAIINPAGTEIVFAGESSDQRDRLYRRRLDQDQATPIAGTEDAGSPFFSPDGQWLGFMQHGRMKKMPAGGGGSIDVADAPGNQGATFTLDGGLIFNRQHGEGLWRATAIANQTPITTVAFDKGEAGHHWPHLLPGGKHLLFTTEIDGKPYSEARIELLAIDTGERRVLIEGGSDARYISTGHIVYWREGDLWGAPFDLSKLQLTGPAVTLVRGVMLLEPNGVAQFSVADNGTLVFLSGRDPNEEHGLLLVDRSGTTKPLTEERRAYDGVMVSPDGRRLVLTTIGANDSLWTMEIGRPSLTRVTYEAENSRAVWSPDGSRLVLARHRGGEPRRLYVMPSDGRTAPVGLRDSTRIEVPMSWTPHGNLIAFGRLEESADIWVGAADDLKNARPFVNTRYDEGDARFSPDGKWLLYASNETGSAEVYLAPYPGPGQKRTVSTHGGSQPRWRGDGREIYYRDDDAIYVASVTPAMEISTPQVLFRGEYMHSTYAWDVLPDGKSFVMIRDFSQPRTALTLVQGWFEELRK